MERRACGLTDDVVVPMVMWSVWLGIVRAGQLVVKLGHSNVWMVVLISVGSDGFSQICCNVGRYLCSYRLLVLTSTGLDSTLNVSLMWIPKAGPLLDLYNMYSICTLECVLDTPCIL